MGKSNLPDEAWEAHALECAKKRLRLFFERWDDSDAAHHDLPDIEDSRRVRESALAGLARHGAPLDAPGQRLYLLGWEGGLRPRVKVGMGESWDHFVSRVVRHEHDAELSFLVLFDGWVSKARPSVREWETRARHALERVSGVQRIHREYFEGIDFPQALRIVLEVRDG